MLNRPEEYYAGLIAELCRRRSESEWFEFKANLANPEEIGEYLSALSNGAALAKKPAGYLIWGVEDATHTVVGTTFEPESMKVGNEHIDNWLARLLTNGIAFHFQSVSVDGKRLVVLEVECAQRHPTRFRSDEWIRVGSHKKRLKEHPDRERDLWRTFDRTPFEAGMRSTELVARMSSDSSTTPPISNC